MKWKDERVSPQTREELNAIEPVCKDFLFRLQIFVSLHELCMLNEEEWEYCYFSLLEQLRTIKDKIADLQKAMKGRGEDSRIIGEVDLSSEQVQESFATLESLRRKN